MSRARRDPVGSLENGAVIVGVGLAGHQLKTQLPISVRSGRRVESVDRDRREVLLGPGQVLRYEQLVLATGVRARTLDVSGLPLAGVCTLRMLHHAQLLRRRLDDAKNVLVVGAGFIAGLVVDRHGIVVDEFLRTSDPFVYAIGDVISFPSSVARGQARVESVQNAIDQPRYLADTHSGTPSPYQDLPWFWSHQAGSTSCRSPESARGMARPTFAGHRTRCRFPLLLPRGQTGRDRIGRPAEDPHEGQAAAP